MHVLSHLLRTQRDQNAEHDDPNFARRRAPTVQRFGKVKMHATLPGK
jgi:uncharacterized protein (UPF0303 family)